MTHKELYRLILKWLPQVPLDDADNQLALAQSAYAQFCHMTYGREDLFHSSYSELVSVMSAVINAWCVKALRVYLPSDSVNFNTCVMRLFDALREESRFLIIQPVDSCLPYAFTVTFPYDFLTVQKGIQ